MAEDPDTDLDEKLIAYVRGRLPEPEAERIAARAADDPELAADIGLMRSIAAAVDADASAAAPGELGWARLSRALDKEAPAAKPARGRPPLWQLAAAAAVAVLIWQVAAVPLLAPPGTEPGYVPVTEAPADAPTLSVAFAPQASEEAIRTLLQEVGARISDGPSAIGLWELRFESTEARDTALARLETADIVESVQ